MIQSCTVGRTGGWSDPHRFVLFWKARMRTLPAEELRRVLRPLADARPFGGVAYADAEVFAFEQARIFAQSWVCVGRTEDVEHPGDWLRETVATEAILVVRGADLRLRAFLDVCRHRGASLVGGRPCGRTAELACRYHGWRYGLDGRLREPARHADGDLFPVRADTWNGFVFVCLAADVAPLATWLGEPPPWLATPLLVKRARRTAYVVDANWKFLVENFQESHHFPSIHQGLEAVTPTRHAQTWTGSGRWLGGTMTIEGAETVSLDGSRHGRPQVSIEGRVLDAMLFPGLLTSVQPDYLITYRLRPLSAGSTHVTAEIHFHPAAFIPGFDAPDVHAFWDRVNAEDRAICEDQQRNTGSRGYDPIGYAPVEEGVHAFDTMVATIHLEAQR